jgi:RHS repeat-associated protein
MGRLISATDNGHLIARTLDDFDNVLIETIDSRSYARTYDPLNRLKSITLPDLSSIEYTYNDYHLSHVRRLTPTGSETYLHNYESYDLSGNLLLEHLIHDLGTQSHTWNGNGAQATLSSPYFNQTITYDSASRVKKISSDGQYEYNDLSELTLEDFGINRSTYTYDDRHNRKEKNGVTTPCNSLDELIEFKYDLNGNIKGNGPFEYTFDALNRLVSATSSNMQITFAYDVFDRCISKSVNGNPEYYLYHDTEELGSFDPNGNTKELKIPGLGLQPIAIELEKKVFAPICDYRGNIRRLITTKTELAESYDYTAFGEDLSQLKALSNPWRYSAKRLDPLLGLYSFGKRFYDPTLGRWISTDPAGLIDGTNLYAYLQNDPLRNFDPTGEFAIPLLSWAIGGAAFCPVTLGVIAAVGVGYAACWSVQQMINNGSVQPGTAGFTIATGVAGALTTSLVNNSLEGNARPFARSDYIVEALPGDAMDFMYMCRKKEGSVDPTLPIDPHNNDNYEDVSHPNAKGKGHHKFRDKRTGEVIEYDEAKPGQPGHKGHDHYHRPNPNRTGKSDWYLDSKGNPVPDSSEPSHLYPPEWVWWK